jgi:TPP-dependent pyruvate/acetoin dehydrogenase alpha subunit
VGSAFAEKFKGSGGIAAVFFGDGAMGEGAIYESFNIASLWKLPVLFVLEDNGYAQSTPKHLEHAGDLSTRAASFAVPSTSICANDVLAVHQAARRIVGEIRSGGGPQFLALKTSRLASHSKGDDTRDADEIAALWAQDPLAQMRAGLNRIDAERLDLVEHDITAAVEHAVAVAVEDKPTEIAAFLKSADPR